MNTSQTGAHPSLPSSSEEAHLVQGLFALLTGTALQIPLALVQRHDSLSVSAMALISAAIIGIMVYCWPKIPNRPARVALILTAAICLSTPWLLLLLPQVNAGEQATYGYYIRVRVYEDSNNDGAMDGGETAVSGIRVFVRDGWQGPNSTEYYTSGDQGVVVSVPDFQSAISLGACGVYQDHTFPDTKNTVTTANQVNIGVSSAAFGLCKP